MLKKALSFVLASLRPRWMTFLNIPARSWF
jgi:hypothetical protein